MRPSGLRRRQDRPPILPPASQAQDYHLPLYQLVDHHMPLVHVDGHWRRDVAAPPGHPRQGGDDGEGLRQGIDFAIRLRDRLGRGGIPPYRLKIREGARRQPIASGLSQGHAPSASGA